MDNSPSLKKLPTSPTSNQSQDRAFTSSYPWNRGLIDINRESVAKTQHYLLWYRKAEEAVSRLICSIRFVKFQKQLGHRYLQNSTSLKPQLKK